jgi:hypothetical protein
MVKSRKVIFFSILLIFCMSGTTSVAYGSIALSYTGGEVYKYVTDPLPNTVGWEFSLSAPVIVTGLGFFDFLGDGLEASHPVAIWDNAHNQVASTVVSSADLLVQSFRWDSIAPVRLEAGVYRIGALINNNDAYISATASQTTVSPVSYVGGVYSVGGFCYPNQIGYTNSGRFGPNFEFYEFGAVPEPSTIIIWSLIGGLGIAVGWWRKQKTA